MEAKPAPQGIINNVMNIKVRRGYYDKFTHPISKLRMHIKKEL